MSTRVAEQGVPSTYSPPSTGSAAFTGRIASLDLMRGVVMVLMAIDHVRVYSGVPAGGPSAGVFFTRWVTHFCAPAFVFLAGTAAYFHARKLGDTGRLSRYLVTRGALLVALELTVVKLSWTFNVDYSFTLAGVIWVLGWCMIVLGALVRLRPLIVGWTGVAIVVVQQVFAIPPRLVPALQPAWEFIYPADGAALGGIVVLYVLVPWVGVMAAGYGFGSIMERPAAERNRLLVRIGIGATAAFLIAASTVAGLQSDSSTPFIFRLLDQQKYPASQLYLLMTLGPMIALLPLADRARGAVARATTMIGRVPMFYYLAHIPLIHLSALAVNAMRTGATHQEWYGTAPFTSVPEESRWPLWVLYAVFAIDVALLYLACRWYARVKAERRRPWMQYI